MTKNLKIFFISLFLSLPFWWIFNISQNNKTVANNTEFFVAQVSSFNNTKESLKIVRKKEIPDIQIDASSTISVYVNNQGEEKILFEKNAEEKLPIASLTKLMTTIIVLEYYNLQTADIIDSLYPLLINSDNNTTEKLAQMFFSREVFIELMNFKAKKLELNNTYFFNPTGLDPKKREKYNYSTAKDLVKLAKYITKEHPLIWDISKNKSFEGKNNTNKILEEIPDIIGGKTGETKLAQKCLLLIISAPKNNGYIINVILGSKNHFEEMKQLVNWVKYAYEW